MSPVVARRRPTEAVGSDGGFSEEFDRDRFRHLVEHVQDAVVEFEFVGGDPVVRGINPAFVDVFGYERNDIVGAPLNEYVVPAWLEDEASGLDDRTSAGKVNYRRVRRETADGIREFLYRGIPFETEDGRVCGFAIYTDLTADKRNRSQVDVLNRVLRHNLRNTLTLVAGSLEGLLEGVETDELDPETRQLVENTRVGLEELRTLSREASELYRTVELSVPDDAHVDCVPLIRSVAGQFGREYPDAVISLDLPETLSVAATDRLEVALTSLVENAIEHNDGDVARVWIEADVDTEKWCCITVADDGPGIPPVERNVVTGETEISDLDHGSGLGLWLVKWTVESFGGEIHFEDRSGGGSRVRLQLRRWHDE